MTHPPRPGLAIHSIVGPFWWTTCLSLMACAGLAACSLGAVGGPANGEITVFAASSLTNAFGDMAQAYEARNPHVKIITNFAASSQLATQLIEGASADVYASADQRQMAQALSAGRIDGQPQIFATNHLVVIVPANNPAHIESLVDLGQPGLKLVLAAPGVPVRVYTNQALSALAGDPAYGSDFASRVLANLASEEQNVRQVSAKVVLGEADAGIVYTSDVTPDIADKVTRFDIPDWANPLAEYPMALVTHAPHRAGGRAFVDFVLSDSGQAILEHWGFGRAP
jgi:molybdate transport system substrate-binding protein